MSLDYSQKIELHGTWSTPSDEDVLLVIPSSNYDYYMLGIQATPRTAGVAAGQLRVETYAASPVNIGTLTVGTTAKYATVELIFVEANRLVSAGTEVAVLWNVTEGTGIGDFILHKTSSLY